MQKVNYIKLNSEKTRLKKQKLKKNLCLTTNAIQKL